MDVVRICRLVPCNVELYSKAYYQDVVSQKAVIMHHRVPVSDLTEYVASF